MKKIFFLTLILLPFITTAQNITGKAYYQSKTSFDIDKMTGQDMDETTKKMIIEKLKKSKEKNYILTFNKYESIYKEEEKLTTDIKDGLVIIDNSTPGITYKNLKENSYTKEEDLLGKKFLVKDTITHLDWNIENKTKTIGQYTVVKATAFKKIIIKNPIDQQITPKDENSKKKDLFKEILITAWFAPQIPVSNGPGEYGGLPGLILELNVQRTTFLCSKIILNPKESITIKAPTKGKKVSKSEYDSIVSKKMEEMQNNFINGKSSGFKIGG